MNSSCDYSSEYLWEIKKQRSVEHITETTGSLLLNNYAFFAPGNYTFSLDVTVNIQNITSESKRDSMYVWLVAQDFVVGLVGGTLRYEGSDADIEINAEDASFDPSSMKPFLFTWKCRKMKPDEMNIDTVVVNFTTGLISLDTIGSDCSELTSNTGKFKFLADNVAKEHWYIFAVYLQKSGDSRTGKAVQAVYVEKTPLPMISIVCHRNCLKQMAPNTRIVLEAKCTKHCDGLTYAWSMDTFDESQNEFKPFDFNNILDTGGNDTDTLGIISDNHLEEGKLLKFTAIINTRDKQETKASYTVSVNKLPHGGTCDISPKEGYAGETPFTMSCKNWKDDSKSSTLTYMFYQGEKIISDTADAAVQTLLGIGDPNDDNKLEIKIRISDEYHGYTEKTIYAKVKNPLDTESTQTEAEQNKIISDLSASISKGTDNPAVVLRRAEAVSSIVQTVNISEANVTDDIVESQPDMWKSGLLDANEYGNETKSYDDLLKGTLTRAQNPEKVKLQKSVDTLTDNMLESLKKAKDSYAMVELGANSFTGAINKADVTSTKSAINAADALNILTNTYAKMSEKQLQDFYGKSNPYIEQSAKSLFSLANNLVDVTVPADLSAQYAALSVSGTTDAREYVDGMASINKNDAAKLAEKSELTPRERAGIYKLRAKIEQYKFHQKRILSEKTMKVVTSSARAVIERLIAGTCRGCNDKYTTPNLQVSLTTNYRDNVNDVPLLVSGAKVKTSGISTTDNIVKYAATNFKRNPYIYGDKNDLGALISSDVVDVTLTDQQNNVVTTKAMTIIQKVISKPKTIYPSYVTGDPSHLFYHHVFYRNRIDNLCIQIQPLSDEIESYDIFVRQRIYPTHLTFDTSGVMTVNSKWKACFSPGHFKRTGLVYYGLRPHVKSDPKTTMHPLARYQAQVSGATTDHSLSPYNMTTATAACLTWDKNEERWRSDKCSMTWDPDGQEIECTCKASPGTAFGNTFYVPPNTIDFSTVFLKFSPLNQAAVISILVFILIVYIFLLIWSRHKDQQDIVKWGITPLADNIIGDLYHYIITVHTGIRRGAGTTSRVGFVLSGSKGESRVRELKDVVRKGFPRASVMNFLMSTNGSLGDLDYVYIWHDSSGKQGSTDWYLNRIDIEDVQTDERYVFLAGRWLTVDNIDTPEVILPVCGKDNISTFKNMFFINATDSLAESHALISIFYRPTRSHFTRAQRTTCFILLLMLTMIANAVYFKPEDEFVNSELVRVGPLVFSWQVVYVSLVSVLITTPLVLLVVLLFKKSSPRTIYQSQSCSSLTSCCTRKHKDLELVTIPPTNLANEKTFFPWWFTIIAWALSLIGCIACAFFLVLFSMQWGKQKSEMWLTQFCLSFFEASVFIEPLKIFVLALILAVITAHCGKLQPTFGNNKLEVKELGLDDFIGYKTGITKPSVSLSEEVLQAAREKRKSEIRMVNAIKECLATLVFLWIMYSITISNRDIRSFRLRDTIVKQIANPYTKDNSSDINFSSIKTMKHFVTWIRGVAFPVLFPQREVNQKKLHWRWKQYFSDFRNFRVGPPRLRQLRVHQETIKYPYIGSTTYYPDYEMSDEDRNNYCTGWKNLPCDLEQEAYSFSSDAWKFIDASDIWGIPITGEYNTYGGGGYIVELDVNLDFSVRILDELEKNKWFDRQTRAVFFEFTLYSPHMNMFAYIVFIAEFPETGGITPMINISPFRIYTHHGSTGIYVMINEILFLVFLIIMSIRIVLDIVKTKLEFFKNTWKMADFVCLLMGFSAIGVYFYRLYLADATLAKFKDDPKQFVNFQHIVYVDFVLVVLLAVISFIATFRLVGLLGYDERTGTVFRVVQKCGGSLFSISLTAFYILIGYGLVGFAVFGTHIYSYRNIAIAMETLFTTLIGKNNYKSLEDKEPHVAPFYYFTYIFVMIHLLLSMFLAILGESISAVQMQDGKDTRPKVLNYIFDRIRKLVGISKEDENKKKYIMDKDIAELITLLKTASQNIHEIIDDKPEIYKFYLDLLEYYKLRLHKDAIKY